MPKKQIGRNITPASKSTHTPSNSWFNNAMRSMGLSSVEMIKNISPSMYEFATTNTGFANELVKEIRENKVSAKRISENIAASPYMKVGTDIFKNAISDLKTGKFINPERQKELDKAMMDRMMGGDIDEMFADFESSFDDVDFDDTLDDERVTITNNNVVNTETDNNANVYATLMVTDSINKQTQTQVETSKATVDTMVTIASNQMMFNKQLGSSILGELGSINENLAALIEYNNENMTKYIEASLKYYEESTRPIAEEYDDYSSNKVDVASIFSKGGFNLREYGKAVMGNVKGTYSSSMVGSLVDMVVENPEIFAANPLSLLTVPMMEAMVPKALKSSIKHLDNTFKSFFPTMLGKVADLKDSSNPMLSLGGSIFGIKEDRKNDFKMNVFEKGAIPFDGVTKHAIVEVIPTYLRKILAAVSGSKEIAYDWNTGKYTSVDSLRSNVYDTLRSDITGQFRYSSIGDELEKYKEMLTESDKERFDTLIDNFFVSLEKYGEHFNPFDTKNGDPFKNVYKDVDSLYGVEMGNFMRAAIKNMDTNALMDMNRIRQEATRSRNDMMKIMEQNPYEYNLFTVGTDMNVDEATLKGYANARQAFGSSSSKKGPKLSDYLQDIKSVLYRGINVRIDGYGAYTGLSSSSTSTSSTSTPGATLPTQQLSEFDIEYRTDSGLYTSDLAGTHKTEEEIQREIERYNDLSNRDFNGDKIDPNAETGKGPFATIRRKLEKPGLVVADKVRAADNLLYAFMFGSGQQTLETMLMDIGNKVAKFRDKVVEDYIQPLATKLFGTKDEDGFSRDGLFSGAQNSVKDFFNSFRREFTGKGYKDSAGNVYEEKESGETAIGIVKNTFMTIKNSTAEYLFGKKDEENPDEQGRGIIRTAMNNIKDGFNTWGEMIFGPKYNPDGTKKEAIKAFGEELKERAPKTLAGGIIGAGAGTVFGSQLGVLTSLFLPGGPISGAIVGSAVGFLSQSERVKELIFGKEDDNGEYIEGLISKKTQDFFKENKGSIIGGAALGTMKSLVFGGSGGIVGTLVGGPLAGALMGAGFSMLKKSEMVQEVLYGKGTEGEEGYKKGIINSIKDKFKTSDGKNKFGLTASGMLGGMATGTVLSQFGVLGAAMFGPVSGAVAGLALGIASSSDKFRDFMFGEYDEEKQKREGGILGKMGNYLNIEVFQPMKLKIEESAINLNQFLEEKVVSKVADAIDPFAHQLKLVGETISTKFTEMRDKIADTVHDAIVQPVAENLNKYILDPMKSFANKVFGGIFKAIGTVVAAPFTFLSYVTNGMVEDHKERSLNQEREKIWSRDNTKGEKGIKGFFNSVMGVGSNFADTVMLYGSKSRREEAESANAPYISGRDERIRQRNADRDEKYRSRREELERRQNEYRAKQRNARDNGYIDITDAEGEETTSSRTRSRKTRSGNKEQGFFSRMFRGRQTQSEEQTQSNDATLASDVDETSQTEETSDGKRRSRKVRYSRRGTNETSGATLATDSNVEKSTTGTTRGPRNIRNILVGNRRTNTSEEGSDNEQTTPTVQAQKTSEKVSGSVSTPKYRSTVMRHLSDIRDEVKGQLNGVGINISKIRRIVAKRLKDDDQSVEGEDNTSELTFVDKLMYALSSPLKAATGIVMAPFKALSSLIGGVVNAGKGVVEGIASIPGKLLSGAASIMKGFGSLAGNVLKSLLSIPKALGEIGVEVVKGTTKVLATGISGLLSGLSTVLNGAASLIGNTLKAAGTVISGTVQTVGAALAGFPEFIENSARAIGSIAGSAMVAIGKAGKSIVSMIGTALSGTLDLIGKGLKTATDAVVTVASGAMSLFGLPFKMVGDVIGRATGREKKAKVLEGGTLDGIRNPIKVMNAGDATNKALHVIIDDSLKTLTVHDVNDTGKEDSPIRMQADNISKILLGVTAISSVLGTIANIVGHVVSGGKSSTATETQASEPVSGVKSSTSGPTVTLGGKKIKSARMKGRPVMAGAAAAAGFGAILSSQFEDIMEEQEEKAEQAEIEKDFEHASRKTSAYMIAQRSAEMSARIKDQREETSLALLTDIRDETREHRFTWSSIFGKKGLITGGLLLAAPLIFKFMKKIGSGELFDNIGSMVGGAVEDFFYGLTDGSGSEGVLGNAKNEANDWLDLTGLGSDDGNIFQRTGNFIMDDDNEFTNQSESRLKFLRSTGVAYAKNAKKVVDTTKKVGKTVGKPFGGIAKKVKNKVGASLAQSGVEVLDESGKLIANVGQSKLNKFAGLCDNALKVLKEALEKVVKKFAKGASTGKIGQLLARVSKVLKPANLLPKAKSFGRVLAGAGAAVATFAASELVWGVLGTISGASNPENLFQVNSEFIDGKMRAISTVFKGLLYTTPGSVIDIINEIVYEVLNFNMIHELAMITYGIISSEEEVANLKQGTDEFKAEYESYVEGELESAYQQYLSEGGDPTVSYDTWKTTADVEYKSFSDYNNSKNKSIYGKAWDGIKGAGNWIAEKGSQAWGGIKSAGNWIGTKAGQAWDGLKSGGNWLLGKGAEAWDGLKTGGSNAMKAIGKAKDNLVESSKKWWSDTQKSVSDGLKNMKQDVSDGLTNTNKWFGGLFGMKDDNGKALSLTEGIKHGVSNAFSKLSETKTSISESSKKWWSDTKASLSEGLDYLGKEVSDGLTNTNEWFGSLFGMKDNKGNPLSLTDGLSKAKDNVVDWGRNAVSSISTSAKNWWTKTSDDLTNFFSAASEDIKKASAKLDEYLGEVFGFQDASGKSVSLSTGVKSNINTFTQGVKDKWNSFSQWLKTTGSGVSAITGIGTGYRTYTNFGGFGDTNTQEGGFGETDGDSKNGFAMYAQGDSRWGSNKYVDSTIAKAGCGPTSMAMVATSLIGNKYYPSEMAQKSAQWGTYTSGVGTNWSFFPKAADYYGLDVSQKTPTKSTITTALSKGEPLIISGRRGSLSKDESPFTTGGHFVVAHGTANGGDGLIVNDPRGDGYSKIYKTSNVLAGARSMWSFKNNGGSHPTPSTGLSSFPKFTEANTSLLLNGISSGSSDNNVLGVLSNFFSEFGNRAYNGLLTGVWDSDYSTMNGTSSGISSDMVSSLQDELVNKLFEITVAGEGKYDSVNPNDNGAYSVGKLQFHGERAKTFFTRVYEALLSKNGYLAARASDYASMSGRAISIKEMGEMRQFLNNPTVRAVAEPIQDAYGKELLEGSNMSEAWDMYQSGILKDPRSVVLISDIANTGPAHIKSWRNKYQPLGTSAGELEHVKNSLKSTDSYWGNSKNGSNSRYYNGWMNRIDNAYKSLADWTPSLAGGFGEEQISDEYNISKILAKSNTSCPSFEGGFGDGPSQSYDFVSSYNSDKNIVTRPETGYADEAVEYVNSKSNKSSSETLNEYLSKIVDILLLISDSSQLTSERVAALKSSIKESILANSNVVAPTTAIINGGSTSNNYQIPTPSKNEQLARRIAAGF